MKLTPKEKAIELLDKIYNTEHCGIKHFPNKNYCDCNEMNMFQAKQCALIAVDEILDVLGQEGVYMYADLKVEIYYNEVKHELEKL